MSYKCQILHYIYNSVLSLNTGCFSRHQRFSVLCITDSTDTALQEYFADSGIICIISGNSSQPKAVKENVSEKRVF